MLSVATAKAVMLPFLDVRSRLAAEILPNNLNTAINAVETQIAASFNKPSSCQ